MMKKVLMILVGAFLSISLNAQNSENFGDVFYSDAFGMGSEIVRGDIGYAFSKISFEPQEDELLNYFRNSINFNLDVNPYEHFHIRTSVYLDFNEYENKPPWLSDVFYSIGWYDWRKNTFSAGYENYQPNRFDGDFNWFTNMKRGFFFVSYNFQLLDRMSALKIDKSSQIYIKPFIRFQPENVDKYGNKAYGNAKTIAGTSVRYTVGGNVYVEGAVYFYLNKKSKLPWDPDFTYGFGIFNWRAFKVNISYGNWIANRFPWNEKDMEYHGFMNGEFKANFTWAW